MGWSMLVLPLVGESSLLAPADGDDVTAPLPLVWLALGPRLKFLR